MSLEVFKLNYFCARGNMQMFRCRVCLSMKVVNIWFEHIRELKLSVRV